MTNTAKVQIAVVAGIAILTAWLYLLPTSKSKPGHPVEEKQRHGLSFENVLGETKKQYRTGQLAAINDLEKKIAARPNDLALYDSIGIAWDDLHQPGIAAHYFELKAAIDKQERSYIDAAYRYFDAFKSAEDSSVRAEMVNKAIINYEKVIEINPKNLNAKADLGVCYAEGTATPMKGIALLRDVVAENPRHENAQLNLGFLSVKSNQFEKALERFDKVLEINPARAETYFYKAQTYLQMSDSSRAKENLRIYIEAVKDENAKREAQQLLRTLEAGTASK